MKNTFITKMLDDISEMKSNMEKSAFKVEFISRYTRLTCSPVHCTLAYVFVNQYCTEGLIAIVKAHLLSIDALYDAAYKDFEEKYGKNEGDNENKLLELEKKVSELWYADKVFVDFVRMFNIASESIDDLYNWTAERIACTVLDYMQRYYTNFWDSGKSANEYFLKSLLTTVGYDDTDLQEPY